MKVDDIQELFTMRSKQNAYIVYMIPRVARKFSRFKAYDKHSGFSNHLQKW